jgi:hypothetical protein
VYRRILGPLYDNEKENLRIATNKEIYAIVIKTNITETIRLHRYTALDMYTECKKTEFPRVLYMNLEKSLRGRPRNRWQDEVREDGRIVGGE